MSSAVIFFVLLPVLALDFFDAAVERGRDGVPEVQEGVFFEADIDEHRLEPVLDVFYAAFKNAADDVAFGGPFDRVFLELPVFEQCDTAF